MSETPLTYDQILSRFCALAERHEDIRAVIVIGSQARTENPADLWSDLDLIVVSRDLNRYLSQTDWVNALGQPQVSFLERQAVGDGIERRVLFEGCLDVDFSFIPSDMLEGGFTHGFPPDVTTIFARGYRFVVDKDGFAARLAALSFVKHVPPPPTEGDFLNLCNDYWYHTVWAVKKLFRGEIWMAYACLNNYMSWKLLQMLEWHAHATHGQQVDTWHGGRFLHQWADSRAMASLPDALSHLDCADIQRALLAQMELFRWVARETAHNLHYSYPTEADQYASAWVTGQIIHSNGGFR